MKKFTALLLIFALLFTGCSQKSPAAAPVTSAPAETEAPPTTLPVPDRTDMLEAYRAALSGLIEDQQWPDGMELEYDSSFGTMDSNYFAIADVDGDGQDELIISYTSTYMAGMVLRVFGFDYAARSLKEEWMTFPSVTFYQDGLVRTDASHNHSMSMEFWPFTLAQYNAEAGTFDLIYNVEGWDQNVAEQDADGNPFPDGKDGGQGIVYMVYNIADESTEVLSPAEYEAWSRNILDGKAEIPVNWLSLTDQNIRSATAY